MTLREEMIRAVTGYLREHFPEAEIVARTDALTKNQVFTLRQETDVRHVEVAERWFDQDDGVMLLPNALRSWRVAEAIRRLPPAGTIRVATTGLEPVP